MRKFFTVFIPLTLIFINNIYPQQKSVADLSNYFESAATQYNIPVDVLKSIAYAETRFHNEIPSTQNENGTPPVYGIMGLRNDDWFGHSLTEGAKLIGADPNVVAVNESLNIQAAAALLSEYANEMGIDRNDVQSWRPVIEKYSGIPQDNIKPFFSFEVFKVLHDGTNINGLAITKHPQLDMDQFGENVNPKNKLQMGKVYATQSTSTISQDYPPAVWDPSPNYYNDSNFHQLFLVVHDTEGDFASSLSLLLNPNYQASAHYIIRSSDGYIVQMVREQYAAWHVRCWNRYMLGVEHEGYVDNPAFFTEVMYESSAGLFRHFVDKYNVPVDSFRIIGHYQHLKQWWVNWVDSTWNPAHPTYSFDPTCNTHTDPGKYWNWTHFFNLIKQGFVSPKIVSYSPASVSDSVRSNSSISATFDHGMAHEQTQDAFSITPNVQGTFAWQDSGKTIVFTPSSPLAYSSKYTVTISNEALSLQNKNLDTSYTFDFYTKAYVPLSITDSYPEDNSENISTTLKVMIGFSSSLVSSSLGTNVFMEDSSGNSIIIKNAKYYEVNGKGRISFSPQVPLQNNKTYKIVLKNGIQAVDGANLDTNYVFNFRTSANNYIKGNIIESFSQKGSWKKPNQSSYSFGIDTTMSLLAISTSEAAEGDSSALFSYKFVNDSALAEISNDNLPTISNKLSILFGIWIFGDLSNNLLRFRFSSGSNNDIIINSDTLNWTGWKYIEFPTSQISSNNEVTLRGIQIKHLSGGSDSNMVYTDGIQWRDSLATGIKNYAVSSNPSTFKLMQNYPNPFNPSTIIEYQIPKNEFVSLKVYDVLGRKVADLVNEYKQAGIYKVNLNFEQLTNKNIASGIYFYSLKAGNFTSTKKLILLK